MHHELQFRRRLLSMADWRRSSHSRLRHVCRWTQLNHLDEPEVYAIYPQHVVIGCLRSDSCFAGITLLMVRYLHNVYALYQAAVIQCCPKWKRFETRHSIRGHNSAVKQR